MNVKNHISKKVYILILCAILTSACEEIVVEDPILSSNEVGLINDTYEEVKWGIRYTETSRTVQKHSSDVLPYSERGYYVRESWDWPQNSLFTGENQVQPGQIIVFTKDGETYKITIRN